MKRAIWLVWFLLAFVAASDVLAASRVHVRSYTRRDGTHVRAHTRSYPGSGSSSYSGGSSWTPSYSPSYSPSVNYAPPYQLTSRPALTPTFPAITSTTNAPSAPSVRTNIEPIIVAAPRDEVLEGQMNLANKGFPEAQFAIGMRYLNGVGVPKSPVIGRKWIEIAAENGCERARAKRRALWAEERRVAAEALTRSIDPPAASLDVACLKCRKILAAAIVEKEKHCPHCGAELPAKLQ